MTYQSVDSSQGEWTRFLVFLANLTKTNLTETKTKPVILPVILPMILLSMTRRIFMLTKFHNDETNQIVKEKKSCI